MKTAIVGSRSFSDEYLMIITLSKYSITHVISGGARGADSLAEAYADINNLPKTIILPDWDRFGRSAGFIRNKLIVNASEQVIAFWDGYSKGTADTIMYARKTLPKDKVHVVLV